MYLYHKCDTSDYITKLVLFQFSQFFGTKLCNFSENGPFNRTQGSLLYMSIPSAKPKQLYKVRGLVLQVELITMRKGPWMKNWSFKQSDLLQQGSLEIVTVVGFQTSSQIKKLDISNECYLPVINLLLVVIKV